MYVKHIQVIKLSCLRKDFSVSFGADIFFMNYFKIHSLSTVIDKFAQIFPVGHKEFELSVHMLNPRFSVRLKILLKPFSYT